MTVAGYVINKTMTKRIPLYMLYDFVYIAIQKFKSAIKTDQRCIICMYIKVYFYILYLSFIEKFIFLLVVKSI